MEGLEKLKDIIRNNNMSTRPEYFSGRGATISDLNEEILTGIHKDIKKEFGEEPAANFVLMVADMKEASATAFLNRLYDLYNCEWKHVDRESRKDENIHVPKDKDGNYDMAMGMVGMTEAMHNGGRDDTPRIVSRFLTLNLPKDHKWRSEGNVHQDEFGRRIRYY